MSKNQVQSQNKNMKEGIKMNKNEALGYLFTCDRCNRLPRYFEIFDQIEQKDQYEVFLSVYKDLEFNFDWFLDSMMDFFLRLKPVAMYEKIKKLADAEGYITVYRGKCTKSTSYKKALSWTLDKNKAEWFARRFQFSLNDKCYLYTGKVHHSDVVAYDNERNEKELICLRGSVAVSKTERVTYKPSKPMEAHTTMPRHALLYSYGV